MQGAPHQQRHGRGGGGMYYKSGGRRGSEFVGGGGFRGNGNSYHRPMPDNYHRAPVRVYDMRSLSAALEAAKPGCGEIRKILTSSAFRPRLPGLTKLVSRLSREGHWQKGLEVFEALPNMGLTADTTITNAAISACDRGGQWERALQIFHEMDQHGLCRDTITYSSVISALSKGRQCNIAIEVFNHMMKAGVQPDAVTCCSLIAALDKGGMWQLAEQVFISMYADHPKFRVLLLMMDDEQLPSDLQGAFSMPMPKDTSNAVNFLNSNPQVAAMIGMDRQFSTPVGGFGKLETLHEGFAGSGPAQTPPTSGRLSPSKARKGFNRSPPPMAARRAASAQGPLVYAGMKGLTPIQQFQKMQELQKLEAAAAAGGLGEGSVQGVAGLQKVDGGAGDAPEGTESGGGSSLQKMDVMSGMVLPGLEDLQVADGTTDVLAQLSLGPDPTVTLPETSGADVAATGDAINSSGATASSPAPLASPGEKPPATTASTVGTPPPVPRKAGGSGRLSPSGKMSPTGKLSPTGRPPASPLSTAFAPPSGTPSLTSAFASPAGSQVSAFASPAASTPTTAFASPASQVSAFASTAPTPPSSAFASPEESQTTDVGDVSGEGKTKQISPFTNATAIGDNIFGAPTTPVASPPAQSPPPPAPIASTPTPVQSAFKQSEPTTMQPQLSQVNLDIRRALSGISGLPDMQQAMSGLSNIDMQRAMSGLDVQRAMSAMAGMPDIQKAMSGLPSVGQDQKADVLRSLSMNLDGAGVNSAIQQSGNVQGLLGTPTSAFGSGTPNRMTGGAGQSPFGQPNMQQTGFQSSAMSRASSCPSPGVLLRTTSISNRKTAPNRVCCNALLAAYARASPPQWLKALKLLELMWECGGEVCPDIVSYNTVMKACGNAQQLDIAFQVYQSMRMRGLEPSIATFGTLITVASDAQRYDRVIEVWGWLQHSGLELNITCANAFLSALEKEGRWNEALEFFHSILSVTSKVRPNAVTFNIVMSSYQKRGQPDKVVFVFEDMFAAGVDPSIVTYNTLISAYGQMGDWVKSMEVLQHLIQNDSGIQPTLATFNQVQAALSEGALRATNDDRHKIAECSWRVFQHMVTSSGVQPDMVTYNTIITTLQRVGNTQMVRKLINIMNSGIVEGLRTPGEAVAST